MTPNELSTTAQYFLPPAGTTPIGDLHLPMTCREGTGAMIYTMQTTMQFPSPKVRLVGVWIMAHGSSDTF